METLATELFQDERAEAAEIERLRAMPLSQFRFERTWLKIDTSLVPAAMYGETYLASDEDVALEIRAENGRAIIYGPGEMKRLLDLDPDRETMALIHEAKAILGGRVIETNGGNDANHNR